MMRNSVGAVNDAGSSHASRQAAKRGKDIGSLEPGRRGGIEVVAALATAEAPYRLLK